MHQKVPEDPNLEAQISQLRRDLMRLSLSHAAVLESLSSVIEWCHALEAMHDSVRYEADGGVLH